MVDHISHSHDKVILFGFSVLPGLFFSIWGPLPVTQSLQYLTSTCLPVLSSNAA